MKIISILSSVVFDSNFGNVPTKEVFSKDGTPLLKIKAVKVMPKYPKESNVMKIVFSRKELSKKLKFKSKNVEMTTSEPETETSTGILLDKTPFKRTIDDKHFAAMDATEIPDSDYEVTGVLIYHPFDVTTATSLNAATSTAKQNRDENVAVSENHTFEVTTAAMWSDLSATETSVTTSSASRDVTTENQNLDEAVGAIHDSPSTEVQDVAVSSQNTGNKENVAATVTTETIATTTLTEATTPGSVSTVNSDATQDADPDVAITEVISAHPITFSPSTPSATEAAQISSTAQALAEDTPASKEDDLAMAMPDINTPASDSTSVSDGLLVKTDHTTVSKENDLTMPDINTSASDSTNVSDVLLVTTEPTVDPENIGAVQMSTTQSNIEPETTKRGIETTTEPLPAAASTTTPISQQAALTTSAPSVPAVMVNPTTPKNAFSIFEGGRVFIFNQNLGKSAPSLSSQSSTDKPASKPFFKGIFKAVAKHPITKTLFSTRPANVHRDGKQNMLSTIWNFNSPIFEPKKIHKRHTEVLVTPSPRESVTARKSLIDRLREETSVERAERRHKTVEGLMHAATIAGHFDAFLTGRLKHGVKTLHKLFSTDEETKTKR